MCKCINIEIGSYDNQILVNDLPEHMIIYSGKSKSICIDKCLYNEIIDLWNKGITTTGCCCGHNKLDGFIGVIDNDIDKMIKLGYKTHFNKCRPNDLDSFIPKSIQ